MKSKLDFMGSLYGLKVYWRDGLNTNEYSFVPVRRLMDSGTRPTPKQVEKAGGCQLDATYTEAEVAEQFHRGRVRGVEEQQFKLDTLEETITYMKTKLKATEKALETASDYKEGRRCVKCDWRKIQDEKDRRAKEVADMEKMVADGKPKQQRKTAWPKWPDGDRGNADWDKLEDADDNK